MADVVNRTTVQYLQSVNTPDFPVEDWIINPDLSALTGVPQKYWKVVGDTVVEMTQPEKDAVDAAEAAQISALHQKDLIFAASDEITDITTGVKFSYHLPYRFHFSGEIIATLDTPSDAVVDIDILKEGVSIFTTRLTIDAASITSIGATTPYVIAVDEDIFEKGEKLEVEIIAVGVGATGLKMSIIGDQIE